MPPPLVQRLYLLFTPALCAREPLEVLEEALRGGVDLVQWRVRAPDPDGLARTLETCAAHGVPVIVNDDVEGAVACGAAGAHVGQSDLPARTARELLGPDRWLGVSTHDLAEIDAAVRDGADHLGFGPVFATATKRHLRAQPTGALRQALGRTTLPVFAIGGIDPDNVAAVLEEGAARIAVSRAILRAEHPGRVAEALRRHLDRCPAGR